MPGDQPTYSEILRRERMRSGLSMGELAAMTGLVKSTVYRLEAGEIESPRPQHLQVLARALEIDVEELYAAVGYTAPSNLPDLLPYLRAKFGLSGDAASRIEGYVEALRENTSNHATGEEQSHDDHAGDNNPKHPR